MTVPHLSGLAEVASAYDTLLCDLWGVVHDGVACHPEALAALRRFRAGGGRVVLLSNSPRPGLKLLPRLAPLGLTTDAFDRIVTSGDGLVDYLERRPGPLHLAGPDDDRSIFDGLPITFAGPDCERVVMTTLVHGPTPEAWRPAARAFAASGRLLVCPNPDRRVMHGAELLHAPGAFADDVVAAGGRVDFIGKPEPEIFALALAGCDPARALVIGDGLLTDIAGAARSGLDAVFVESPLHAVEIAAEGFGPAVERRAPGARPLGRLAALCW